MKITELITFCHELDSLEAHLEEHKNFVYRTIIRESKVTYSYIEKPLYFKENESRFSRFNLTYQEVPVEEFTPIPRSYPKEEHGHWSLMRRHNRERSKSWLWDKTRKRADYVFVMDTDEFVSENRFHMLEKCLSEKPAHVVLKLLGLSYFINGRCSKKQEYRIVRADRPTHVRERGLDLPRGTTEQTVGWHFSNCFLKPEDVWLKITGLCHSLGMSVDQVPSAEQIKLDLDNYIEPVLKKKMDWAQILSYTDLQYQPKFVQRHPELFPFYKESSYRQNSGVGVYAESEFNQPY